MEGDVRVGMGGVKGDGWCEGRCEGGDDWGFG